MLGTKPARALATLLNEKPPVGDETTECSTLAPNVLMRFTYSGAPQADAWLVAFGCPSSVAYVGGTGRAVDRNLTAMLVATAGSYGQPGAPAPDLFGKTPTEAAQIAKDAGFTVAFSGQEIDGDAGPGTVLLQNPPAGSSGIGSEIDVILSAHAAAACTVAQLAVDYAGGGAGAGSDFGTIRIRDTGMNSCLLVGPISVTGTDAAGHALTQTIVDQVEAELILTPQAAPVPAGSPVPMGEVMGDLTLAAAYRDDPTSPDGLCTAHQVIPAFWRLVFPGGVMTVANSNGNPSGPGFPRLVTCRGEVGGAGPVSAN